MPGKHYSVDVYSITTDNVTSPTYAMVNATVSKSNFHLYCTFKVKCLGVILCCKRAVLNVQSVFTIISSPKIATNIVDIHSGLPQRLVFM